MKKPLIGATIPTGLKAAEEFIQLRLGRLVHVGLPKDLDEARAVFRLFREHHIYILALELVRRHDASVRWCCPPHATKEEIDSVFAEAGEYFLGRTILGENGGRIYWPKEYLLNGGVGEYPAMPECRTAQEAHASFVDFICQRLDRERRDIAGGRLMEVDSSLVFDYQAEAGLDLLCLEMLPGDPKLMLAAIRGAARAYGLPWGVHIAALWYGGCQFDEIWLKRWKISLALAYISGAEAIYPESGHYTYTNHDGQDFPYSSPETKAVRKALRALDRFSQMHTRPDGGPRCPAAVVHGQDDGHPGIWNQYVWGQYRPDWESSEPEAGWLLVRRFWQHEDVFRVALAGKHDFSGNPASGQFDVVPASGDFSRYGTLIFAGYNRMTDDLYARLIAFVKNGGKLLIWLPHFDTSGVRGQIDLYNGGDLADLCGVRITGRRPADVRGIQFIQQPDAPGCRLPVLFPDADPIFIGHIDHAVVEPASPDLRVLAGLSSGFASSDPETGQAMPPPSPTDLGTTGDEKRRKALARQPLLVEHRLGKGHVWLVTAFNWPGSKGMASFAEVLMRSMMAGERNGDVELLAPDCVRWAVFQAPGWQVVYMLNTAIDTASCCRILCRDGFLTDDIPLTPAELRLAYACGQLILLPEDPNCDLSACDGNALRLATRAQTVTVWNTSDKPFEGTLNGFPCVLARHAGCTLALPDDIPGDWRPEWLDDRYLTDEPASISCAVIPL